MATYLSPGVFFREIDLSATIGGNIGPLRPTFVGTAQKGPINIPTFVSSAQQAVDIFGEPFSESYLMYAVLAYMEEGNSAYIVRVAVEAEEGQTAELADYAIDTSGSKLGGWGRLPLFTGIDYGKINMRTLDADAPYVFHDEAVENIEFTDKDDSSTHGTTVADLNFTGGGTDLSDEYTGSIDDSFIVLITGDPDEGEAVEGATYEVVRNSDNAVVASGTLSDTGSDISNAIELEDGLTFNIEVTDGVLAENDFFRFSVRPNNRVFSVWVEGTGVTEYTMPATSYSDIDTFVTAINALIASEDYQVVIDTDVDGVEYPQFRTNDAGYIIQLQTTEAFANEIGVDLYKIDIPRSYALGGDAGPYQITSQSNRVSIDVLPPAGDTQRLDIALPTGSSWAADDIVTNINLANSVNGEEYLIAYAVTLSDGVEHVLIATNLNHRFDQLKLLANFSNIKTLRFAEEIGVTYPYGIAYRGYTDTRSSLPEMGLSDPSVPLSCEVDSGGEECARDTAYFQNIVGFLVATTAGTWIDDFTIDIALQPQGVGDLAGLYRLTIKEPNGQVVDIVESVSFDPTHTRYIGNVINPGSPIGGTNGNSWVNWEERPIYLNNDPVDESEFEVRQPSQFAGRELGGTANGIPLDPAYSSEIDAAVIGNSATSTGIYTIQNQESYDTNLLCTPGFNSGAVIGQCIQLAEARGDMLYLVDPPFGLRPQQVVDWHNGMLTSDISTALNSSYAALYWGWIKVFDQFNQQDIWVPPSGHVAAVYSRTARDAEQWYAPAGLNRGRILTALELEFNPSNAERDLLYGSGNAVNAIVSFPNEGAVVWGQRTLQRADTALDRVNVRMLLIYLKKNMIQLLRQFIFEPNTENLWAQVRAAINPFLSDVMARNGVDGYKLICDASNNTPERRDRNQLWVSVFVKPTRTVEFVALNLVVLQSSATFQSEEVLAAGGIITRQG